MKFNTVTSEPPKGQTESLWVYNGLDSMITLEVWEEIVGQLNETTQPIYEHALALQAPILEMQLRGVRIDTDKVGALISRFEGLRAQVKSSLQEILLEGYGYDMPFDKVPHYTQLQHFFYDFLGLPPVRAKGQVTTNRMAIERLRSNFHVTTICSHLLKIRELTKKLGFLRTGIDSDQRIRTSFNIAGTDTGRLSSYASAFGSGTNLQNVTEELRHIFVADEGKRLAYIDLEQAEARAVGAIIWNRFLQGEYLDFCESGDLHTNVARMTFTQLPWVNDPDTNKQIAERQFYREDSYRQGCKKLGHATNYHGGPQEIARQTRIPFHLITEFQREYFHAFPGIATWHDDTRKRLLRDGWITTFMGRQRWFFGRRWENETLNAAIAYEPQSVVADYINKGMLALWRSDIPCQILLQEHDALLIQYDEELEAEVIPQVKALLSWEVPLLHGRSLIIPTEAKVGWNWGNTKNAKKELVNPDGLEPFRGHDPRKRSAPVSFMDRRVL